MNNHIKKYAAFAIACLMSNAAWADDFKLHRYASTTVYDTNSFWLESDTGIALIDAQMLISDAKLLAALIKSTGKPVEGAIITHPHTDHFGGLNVLQQEFGAFPVYTTEKTAAGIKPAHEYALTWVPGVHGDDYDTVLVEADSIVESGTTVEIAGIALKIDDIGAGESANSVLIYQPDQNILFTGDATMHHGHFYTGEGHSDDALRQHEYMKTTYGDVAMLYAGHGDPGTPAAILDAEIEHIKFVQSVVKAAIEKGDIKKEDGSGYKDEVVQDLVAQIIAEYPHLSDFDIGAESYVGWNVGGVLSEFDKE